MCHSTGYLYEWNLNLYHKPLVNKRCDYLGTKAKAGMVFFHLQISTYWHIANRDDACWRILYQKLAQVFEIMWLIHAVRMFKISYMYTCTGWAKKTGPLCYIASNFGNTAQIYNFFAEIKVLLSLTRKRNLLKLIMYNSGAIWRIRVMISNDFRVAPFFGPPCILCFLV